MLSLHKLNVQLGLMYKTDSKWFYTKDGVFTMDPSLKESRAENQSLLNIIQKKYDEVIFASDLNKTTSQHAIQFIDSLRTLVKFEKIDENDPTIQKIHKSVNRLITLKKEIYKDKLERILSLDISECSVSDMLFLKILLKSFNFDKSIMFSALFNMDIAKKHSLIITQCIEKGYLKEADYEGSLVDFPVTVERLMELTDDEALDNNADPELDVITNLGPVEFCVFDDVINFYNIIFDDTVIKDESAFNSPIKANDLLDYLKTPQNTPYFSKKSLDQWLHYSAAFVTLGLNILNNDLFQLNVQKCKNIAKNNDLTEYHPLAFEILQQISRFDPKINPYTSPLSQEKSFALKFSAHVEKIYDNYKFHHGQSLKVYNKAYAKIQEFIKKHSSLQEMSETLLKLDGFWLATPTEFADLSNHDLGVPQDILENVKHFANPKKYFQDINKKWQNHIKLQKTFKKNKQVNKSNTTLVEQDLVSSNIDNQTTISAPLIESLSPQLLQKSSSPGPIKPFIDSSCFIDPSPVVYSNYLKTWFTNGTSMLQSHRKRDDLLQTMSEKEIIRDHTTTPLLDSIALLFGKKGFVKTENGNSLRTILYMRSHYTDCQDTQIRTLDLIFEPNSFLCFHRGAYLIQSQEDWIKKYCQEAADCMAQLKKPKLSTDFENIVSLEDVLDFKISDGSYISQIQSHEINIVDNKNKAIHRVILPEGIDKPDLETFNRARNWSQNLNK
ncbi:MAG: hypothetical protein JHC93_08200 [Parachlamydiales bacterium]|nr:hypothetical protein [Parachlamydiales bacterium]